VTAGSFTCLSHVRPPSVTVPSLRKKVPMNKYVLIAGPLSLFLSSAAMAQHSGTEQEQRACASNVQRYCRRVLDQGDFAVLACLQQHREKLTAACRKVLTDHGQ
jgi:Cysteine rich repeat